MRRIRRTVVAALVADAAAAAALALGVRRANRRRPPVAGARPLPADTTTVVTDDGARLAVTVEGDGPDDVVLVHGWVGDRALWDDVAATLVADGHRVIRYDLRGHGRSTTGRGGLGLDRLVGDLDAVLAGVGGQPTVLVGHSIGGLTVLRRAADPQGHPLAGVVAVGSAVPDPNLGPWSLRLTEFGARSPFVEWVVARPRAGLRVMDPFEGRTKDPAHLAAQRASFLATPARVRGGMLGAIQEDLRPALRRCAVPVAVLVGSSDHFAVPHRARDLAEACPGATFVELEGVGHNVPYEAPGAVAAAVGAMLGAPTRSV